MLAKTLILDGLVAAVSLNVDQRFLDALPSVFCNWNFELAAPRRHDIFADVVFDRGKYTLSSPFLDRPDRYVDPVDSICSLVAELAWAHLREDQSLLCLHGAAIEINGRLLVLPSGRRAGKSAFSVAAQAAGHTLYTDDFLPLQVKENGHVFGLSHGVAPRVRLPVPDQIGHLALERLKSETVAINKRYQYVPAAGAQLARFGDSLPLGALVFLEHGSARAPELAEISHDETLKRLIKQNFSRAMNAAGILEILSSLSQSTPAILLKYDAVEPALAALGDRFAQWDSAPARIDTAEQHLFTLAQLDQPPEPLQGWETADIVQARGVHVVMSQNQRFISDPNGHNILLLNDGAANIWQLLESPASVQDVTDMLALVFPDHPVDDIRRDVHNTIASFAAKNLIQLAPAPLKPLVSTQNDVQPSEVTPDA